MGWNSAYRSLSDEMDTHVLPDFWAWHGILRFSYIVLERRGGGCCYDRQVGRQQGRSMVWLRNFAGGVSCDDVGMCIQTLVVAFTRAPSSTECPKCYPRPRDLGLQKAILFLPLIRYPGCTSAHCAHHCGPLRLLVVLPQCVLLWVLKGKLLSEKKTKRS